MYFVCLIDKCRAHSPLASSVMKSKQGIQSGVQNIPDSWRMEAEGYAKIIDIFFLKKWEPYLGVVTGRGSGSL